MKNRGPCLCPGVLTIVNAADNQRQSKPKTVNITIDLQALKALNSMFPAG